MKVGIPTPLQSYTQASVVEAEGATLAELVLDLERQYPGIRFRMIDEQGGIRTHMRIFVNAERAESLAQAVAASDEVQILQALSGG